MADPIYQIDDPIYTDGSFDASGARPDDADISRVASAFVGLAHALQFNDQQTYVGQDRYVANPPGQFLVYTPGVGWGAQGYAVSNGQQRTAPPPANQVARIPVSWLVIGGIAFLLLRR